jgi:hypothetical protein
MGKVTLAGKDYELKPLPIRKAREVRAQFSAPLAKVIEALKTAPKIELSDMQGIGSLLDAARVVMVDSMDICLETLYAYSPEIAADKERIENEAYDEEALLAFVEVVKLLYPFGSLMSSLNGLGPPAT